MVALEHYSFDDVLVVKNPDDEGQDMELLEDERITVKNLILGVLVSSANDAALVLAQNYPGGEETFVERMNQKAQELHLKDTFFANPTGLDSDENGDLLSIRSHTTALDLARLAAVALKNEKILEMVSTSYIEVKDISGEIAHPLYNVNELLGRLPGMKGLKTGWTEEAGECLIGYTEREERGIITVVLKSQDRFLETKKLVDWAFANHTWKDFTPSIRN
jgi:D-alanyl-D-alanine carboxypeptidase (penicillin-binding protein 5/6)